MRRWFACAFYAFSVRKAMKVFIIGRKIHKEKMILPKKVWTLFGCEMFVIVFMIVYYEFVLEEIPDVTMVKIVSSLILLGGISISMMMVAVIYYTNSTIQYRLQNEMSELYNEQQMDYHARPSGIRNIMDLDYAMWYMWWRGIMERTPFRRRIICL